ncbi:hypothetical protein TIFTF001_055101 [Ficus carica]|uniref:Uncharacterized protein n=1 Tax=Ficus carica TaxID=3494 RepID=A0AA88JEC5_FICCA|nr:hypothetical protein TIFTF001_055101 [Ficus carica]
MCEEGKKFNGYIKRSTVRSSTGRGFHPIELVHRDDLGDFLDYGFRHKLAWLVSFRIRALVLVSAIMSHNSIIDGGTDPMLFMEAMMGEMKRVMRLELEQIHE